MLRVNKQIHHEFSVILYETIKLKVSLYDYLPRHADETLGIHCDDRTLGPVLGPCAEWGKAVTCLSQIQLLSISRFKTLHIWIHLGISLCSPRRYLALSAVLDRLYATFDAISKSESSSMNLDFMWDYEGDADFNPDGGVSYYQRIEKWKEIKVTVRPMMYRFAALPNVVGTFDAGPLIGNVHIHQDDEDRRFFTLHDYGAFKGDFLKQCAETEDMETNMSELGDEIDHIGDQNNQGIEGASSNDSESRQEFLAL
ncbi:hypothetical protein LTS18_002600, partial [Coniosporium uncinatum]